MRKPPPSGDRWRPATGGYRKHTGNGASIAISRPNVGCRNCIRCACKTYPASPGKPGSSTMPPPGPYTGSPKRGWPTEARWILIWCGRPVMIWTEHSVLQNIYHAPRRFSSPRSTEDFPESRMGNQADGRANTNRIEGRDTLYHRTVLFLNLRPTLGHFRRSSSIIGKQHNPRRGATKPMKRDSRWMFNLHLG